MTTDQIAETIPDRLLVKWERMTEAEIRELAIKQNKNYGRAEVLNSKAFAEINALTAERNAMKAALEAIAASSKRTGPPDMQYWIDVANDRREIARAALGETNA